MVFVYQDVLYVKGLDIIKAAVQRCSSIQELTTDCHNNIDQNKSYSVSIKTEVTHKYYTHKYGLLFCYIVQV